LGAIVNGWELSGITQLQQGPDLAVLSNNNFNFGGGATYWFESNGTPQSVPISINSNTWLGTSDYSLQPTIICNPGANLKRKQFVNGACFGVPAQGSQGMWNLPDTPGPMYFKSDLSVYKDFKINEHQNMQFRLSGFNFLNHPITSFTGNDPSNPLNLQVGDPDHSHYTSPAEALAGAKVKNPDSFGSTSYKMGERILELGFKYNF